MILIIEFLIWKYNYDIFLTCMDLCMKNQIQNYNLYLMNLFLNLNLYLLVMFNLFTYIYGRIKIRIKRRRII